MKKIFITGISGCVGHYLFDELIKNQDYQLFLLVRDPSGLKFDYQAYSNVTLVRSDIKEIQNQADLLKEMDFLVHLAASWDSLRENHEDSVKLFNLLDPQRCQKVIYFSTASILGAGNKPIAEALTLGPPYIRSKYAFFKQLPELKIYSRVVTLFPTWVLAGDNNHPYSHAATGIKELKKWLFLLRFLTVDISFHFIHARDIAQITKYLLEHDVKEREFVLGNAPITAAEFIRQTCEFYQQKVYWQIPIPLAPIPTIAKLVGKKLHSWDLFCLQKKHFIYKTVNAESFGFNSDLKTVQGVLLALENCIKEAN